MIRPIEPNRVRTAGYAPAGPHLTPTIEPGGKARSAIQRTLAIPAADSAAMLATAGRAYRRLLTGAEPSAAGHAADSWRWLAEGCHALADRASELLAIGVTDEPEPYPGPAEMLTDIRRGNFRVSRANSDHPIWSETDNVAFRVAHDVFGHAASGGDFGWRGELLACAAHAPLLDPRALPALACECIAQTGYAIASGGFADRQVCGTGRVISETIPARLGWLA